MYKNALFVLCLSQLCLTSVLCQTKCSTCFVGLKDHLDSEYSEIVDANKSGKWISEEDLLNMKALKDQYYKSNVLAYRILTEQNWPGSDDSFELIYFSFYRYEFPTYAWAICVYKHVQFDIYNLVSLDVDGSFNSRSGSLNSSQYFSAFHEELSQEYIIDDNYQSGSSLNFSGFSVFFDSQRIKEVRILHDLRNLQNLTTAASRIR